MVANAKQQSIRFVGIPNVKMPNVLTSLAWSEVMTFSVRYVFVDVCQQCATTECPCVLGLVRLKARAMNDIDAIEKEYTFFRCRVKTHNSLPMSIAGIYRIFF